VRASVAAAGIGFPGFEEKLLSVICPALPWRPGTVARVVLLPLVVVMTLVACSSNSNRGVTGNVGIGTGIALATPGSVTQIQQDTTIVVTASVTADVNNAGVTWQITGGAVALGATLSDITATSVTFNAPASVNGAADATVTATSVVNPATAAAVTLIVLGKPQMNPVQLFPGNVNVPYAAPITVAGGLADFTWSQPSGTLPPGIILNGSSSSITAISGTPTTAGTYTFTVQASDANAIVTSQTITMVVLPQATCLLLGRFSYMFSGFRGGGPATDAGSITVDGSGNITGEHDYKDGHRTTPDEILTSGNCINKQTNSGQITLTGPTGTLLYNFSVTPPDSTGSINSARLQLIGSGSDSGSGQMARLDPSAITAAPPIGNFAYGLMTVANQEPITVHSGSAGRFTTDSTGTISAGLTDSNASPALTAAPLTGALSPPDSNGRGTATFTAGGTSSTLVYYIVNAARIYLEDMNPTVATPRSTGFLTPQVGDVADGAFDNGALGNSPSIISLWGAQGTDEPLAVMTLGRLFNGDALASTISAVLDTSDHDTDTANVTFTAQPYTVASSGRGTLSITGSGVNRNFVFYLDGVADGYVVELGTNSGNAGLLEAQYTPPGGAYPDTLLGFFVAGTQFAQTPGPISLVPSYTLSFGTLSGTYSSGQFDVDTSTGRGFGTIQQTAVPVQSASLYLVSPTKMDIMTFGTISEDGAITWLIAN
jgi:hypothetical protein